MPLYAFAHRAAQHVSRARRDLPRERRNPRKNKLLAVLPQDVFKRLLPRLELLPMQLSATLYESGGWLEHVYWECRAD
jgi:hypothetical protein